MALLPLALVSVVGFREVSSYITVWSQEDYRGSWSDVVRWELSQPVPDYLLIEGRGTPPALAFPAVIRGTKVRIFSGWPDPGIEALPAGSTVAFYFSHASQDTRYIDLVEAWFPGGQTYLLPGRWNDPFFDVYRAQVLRSPHLP